MNLYCLVLEEPNPDLLARVKAKAPEHYEVGGHNTWLLIQSSLDVEGLSERLGLNDLSDDDTATALLKLNGARAGYFYQSMWDWISGWAEAH